MKVIMRYGLLTLLVLLLYITFTSDIVRAEEYTYNNDDYTLSFLGYDMDNDGVNDGLSVYSYSIIEGKDEENVDIIIPEEINGSKVLAIDKAFYEAKVKSIVIPNTVKQIYDNAFFGCSNITSINIPSNAKIGEYAFYNCEKLISVNNLENADSIGKSVFGSCKALKEVKLPTILRQIPERTFTDCIALETITIPEAVNVIDENAFSNCSSLKTITFPKYLKKIKKGAFDNTGLTGNIIIPASVDTIEDYAFTNCNNITDVTFDGKNTYFGSYTFHGLMTTQFDNITFHLYKDSTTDDTLKSWYKSGIKVEYFEEEEEKEIIKKGSIIKKGDYQYLVLSTIIPTVSVYEYNYNSKKNISIPDSIKEDNVVYNVTKVSSDLFSDDTKIKKITIGRNVTEIESNAFKNCKNLKSIIIKSDKISKIGKNAIKNINKKAVIKVPKKSYKKYKKLFTKKTGFKKGMKIKKI